MRGNCIRELFVFLRGYSITNRINLCLHFGQPVNRETESRRAEQMIGMIVRHVETSHRLAERCGIGQRLFGVRNRILRIDRDELRWELDEMSVDHPSVVRSRIGVDS